VDWLRERGVEIIDMDSSECAALLAGFVRRQPDLWLEDIGEG